ncbi:MAG: flagellar FlbD family protein [Anaerolineales bacterium]|nr:flagellar FlbD family protein [Anaerolineales bacterium]
MIPVTRFNGSTIYLNAELIQSVEGTPDTVITLTNQVKIVVKDSPTKVVEAIIAYQRKVHTPLPEIAFQKGEK